MTGLKKRDVFFLFFLFLEFLGEFAKLRKAIILVFVTFARLHGTAARLPPDWFSWNLIFEHLFFFPEKSVEKIQIPLTP